MTDEDAVDIHVSDETRESIARLKSLRPITDLLNFRVERKLMFDPSRKWDFEVGRELSFDLERARDFDENLGLQFGSKSVIFRGYVCPACGHAVRRNAKTCPVCTATFDSPVPFNIERKGTVATEKAVSLPESVPRRTVCGICGMRNPEDAAYCVECGNRMGGGSW